MRKLMPDEQVARQLLLDRPAFRAIEIGTHDSVEDLCRAVEANGDKINWQAIQLMNSETFVLTVERTVVELVVATVQELCRKPEYIQYIHLAGLELGWRLCPSELGPQLRLQYGDQPPGERLFIAMDPVMDPYGQPGIFNVSNRDGQWLNGEPISNFSHLWSLGCRFVFIRKTSRDLAH